MPLELRPVTYKGRLIYAAIDVESGKTIAVFTQFMTWIALGKSIRKTATRGLRPANLTLREYAYRLKRWFEFISDWNEIADMAEQITWQTAQKKHMDFFSDKLANQPHPIKPSTRNGLRLVWEMFYDEFCPFMGYSHLMFGLSEIVELDAHYSPHKHETMLGNTSKRKLVRKSLGKYAESEDQTYRVLSPNDISLLLTSFEDVVFSCLSYLMYATGLRIGGALQVPYPDTDKNNPYITSPILIARDYGITDNFFPFKYIQKGHEQLKDFAECDVPIYAWQDIWNVYHDLLEDRLLLWRRQMVQMTGNNAYKRLYPKYFWLNKEGKEVTATDVWKAFRDTRRVIQEKYRLGFPNVTPHMLRHSYATWMIIDITKKENISLDPNNDSSVQFIHQYLQEQLGHKWRSTTVKYIKTALRVVKRRWIPKVRLSSGKSVLNGEQDASFARVVDFGGLMTGLKKELATED